MLKDRGLDPYTWYVGNKDENVHIQEENEATEEEPAAVKTTEPTDDHAEEVTEVIVDVVGGAEDFLYNTELNGSLNLEISDTTETETSKNCRLPDSQASSSSDEIMFGSKSAKRRKTLPTRSVDGPEDDIDSDDSEQLELLESLARDLSDLSDNEDNSIFKKVMKETIFGPDYQQ